jgi:hypothetical protein
LFPVAARFLGLSMHGLTGYFGFPGMTVVSCKSIHTWSKHRFDRTFSLPFFSCSGHVQAPMAAGLSPIPSCCLPEPLASLQSFPWPYQQRRLCCARRSTEMRPRGGVEEARTATKATRVCSGNHAQERNGAAVAVASLQSSEGNDTLPCRAAPASSSVSPESWLRRRRGIGEGDRHGTGGRASAWVEV